MSTDPYPLIITSESGLQGHLAVRLTAPVPDNATVVIPVWLSRPAEAALSVSEVVFNSSNWQSWQNITVSSTCDDRSS